MRLVRGMAAAFRLVAILILVAEAHGAGPRSYDPS